MHAHRLDFSYVFKYDVSIIEEYCSLFPEEWNQIDLIVLKKQCDEGRFEGTDDDHFSGLLLLFDELDVMVRNCKRFNDENCSFQTWRCADMMEEALFDLKESLSEAHNDIECLQAVVDQCRKGKIQEDSRQEIEM